VQDHTLQAMRDMSGVPRLRPFGKWLCYVPCILSNASRSPFGTCFIPAVLDYETKGIVHLETGAVLRVSPGNRYKGWHARHLSMLFLDHFHSFDWIVFDVVVLQPHELIKAKDTQSLPFATVLPARPSEVWAGIVGTVDEDSSCFNIFG
jgi:hypothetical protein